MTKTPPPDPRGGHSRVYWSIQDSPAWRALTWSEQALYLALRRKLKAANNGNIEATISTLRHAGFKSPSTIAKGLRALQTVGLIDKTRQGGIAHGTKKCCLYRFTDEAVYDQPKINVKAMSATNDWQSITAIAEAKALISAAHARAKRSGKKQ